MPFPNPVPRWVRRLALAGIALGPTLALAPVGARAQSDGGYGLVTAWSDWAKRSLPGERAVLVSSTGALDQDPDANRYESPLGLITYDVDTVVRTLTGPGVVTRFWMPHRAAIEPFAIRMIFDGEAGPGIDGDSGQILGGTFGYFADPLVTTFAGGQVSYEPIPFRESLRIESENIAERWHWYQYSVRLFPPGTDVASYDGTLDSREQAARLEMVSMFENTGQHPAGESVTAVRTEIGTSLVPPGGTLTMADLAGPGRLRRLTLRMVGASDADLDSLHLRVTYDQANEPAIDAPVGWFFGAGHGRAPYRSLPMGTDSPDGFYCYWPMPFHLSIRVELANVSGAPIAVDATMVENEPGPVGPDECNLHAVTNEEIVVNGQTRNVMASVTGAGHYVGNLLYVEQDHDTHFFLEADDIVFVDGALATNGTGLEDAYNGGHYYNWVPDPIDEPEGQYPAFAIRPLHGILRVERTTTPPFGRADQYRWMIADRVPFSQSLEVQVETSYSWAGSRWTSVVFWYQVPTFANGSPERPVGESHPGFGLSPSAPNPVAESTVLRFELPEAGSATLEIFDVAGRRVASLLDGPLAAGPHAIPWNPTGVANGIYLCRLRVGDLTETRKLVVARD